MSGNTIITILILAVIAVVAFITVRNYRKQLKEGCCGAGGDDGPGAKVEPKDTNQDNYKYIADVKITVSAKSRTRSTASTEPGRMSTLPRTPRRSC